MKTKQKKKKLIDNAEEFHLGQLIPGKLYYPTPGSENTPGIGFWRKIKSYNQYYLTDFTQARRVYDYVPILFVQSMLDERYHSIYNTEPQIRAERKLEFLGKGEFLYVFMTDGDAVELFTRAYPE